MPIVKSIAKKCIKTYGYKKGKEVYFSLEADNKPPFRKARITATKKGHVLKNFPRPK